MTSPYNRFLLVCLLFACVLVGGCTSTDDPMQNLTAEIEQIVSGYDGASVSVSIIDTAGEYELHLDGDRLYHAASTMKVPVMIELFRQAELGRFSLDDEVVLKNEFRSIVDGSLFSIEDDSDDAIYEQLGSPMTLRQLSYNMITVSSNLATNLLIDFLSADSVQATSERLGTTHMQTIRGVEDLKAFDLGMSNKATSRDLAILMERLRSGTAVSASADSVMLSMLHDQFFNAMIPSGLPQGSRVAHKTGSITEIHHDAAIVYPENGDPYVLVIMTQGIADSNVSSELGAAITRQVHARLRGIS
jgi:beta-lactamase class A